MSFIKKNFNRLRRSVACRIVNRKVTLNLPEAVVSFVFDDVPESAVINGGEILKKYGFSGTYYVSLGLKATNSDKDYFNKSLLKHIVDSNGELGCHTFSHPHFYNLDKKQVEEELNRNIFKLKELFPDYNFDNFSYPYGEQTIVSKRLVNQRFRSARGVKAGINSGVADLNNLKACQLDSSLDLVDILSLIEEAKRLKGWLILYTHDVEENPSEIGCSPLFYESVVKYCFQKNIKVKPIGETLDEIEGFTVAK